MGRPSTVIDRIMPYLNLFVEQGKQLPSTNDGKINVYQLCQELRTIGGDIKEADSQHFFRKKELKNLVNTIAKKQGLHPICHRAPADEANELELRYQSATQQAEEDSQTAVEATAAQEALLKELKQVRVELEDTKLTNSSLKERLRFIEERGFLV